MLRYDYRFTSPTTKSLTSAERMFLESRKNVPFFASMLSAVARFGGLTPKQHAAVVKAMASDTTLADKALAAYEAERDQADNLLDLFAAQQAAKAETPTPGIYQLATGEIFKVKFNKAKTNVYAEKLTESAERLNENDELVTFEYVYAPGAIKRITPADKMSAEAGAALSIKYGRCLNCGRKLKAAASVAVGMGPKCLESFMGALA
jgi:hypothetical protein